MASGDNPLLTRGAAPVTASTLHGTAKFHAPLLPPGYIRRPRVEARLDAATGARLTVVSGRAGSGKSVLISSWLASLSEDDFSWVTLDEDDNKPSVFWSDVTTAVDRLSDDEYGRFMAARADHDGYLVVDDAHVLMSIAARRSLVQLVALAPSWLHLIVASREQPALALWRLRAEGALVEIDDEELRLDAEEASQLVAQHDNVATATAPVLRERAEGWLTGMRLLAAAADTQSDADEAIREYLLEEVFARHTPDVQQFLMETSCLSLLTPVLCEHLTARADAADLLHDLERSHSFISRHPGRYATYRCHSQFRAVLRDELQARDPDRAAEIHVAAAHWYREHDDPAAAVEQWIAARSVPGARHISPISEDSFEALGVVDIERAQHGVTQLSPRELEVLSYLPTRLSARQIADALFVSRNTLKTHMHNVYRKLDCASREDAVDRARMLGLLR
jgi:LuxR family transcriptional regulator, maltose regulon positive regulatory protein